jgi:hypothetical protein
MTNKYAELSWCASDVQDVFDATDEEAEAFLIRNQKHLRDRLCDAGYQAIESLGLMDGLPPIDRDIEQTADIEVHVNQDALRMRYYFTIAGKKSGVSYDSAQDALVAAKRHLAGGKDD